MLIFLRREKAGQSIWLIQFACFHSKADINAIEPSHSQNLNPGHTVQSDSRLVLLGKNGSADALNLEVS
jgi:hypothetical protein